MPAGIDLRRLIRETSAAELQVLCALIAEAEPTGHPGELTTDTTAQELAERYTMSRSAVDRALNGNPATGARGLTAAGLISAEGQSGHRVRRRLTLPLYDRPPNAAPSKTDPTLHNIHCAALMRHENRAAEPQRDPNIAADMRRQSENPRPTNAARPNPAPQNRSATAPHQRGATTPLLSPQRALPPSLKTQQQQQQEPAGLVNDKAEARRLLMRELTPPAAERFTRDLPPAVILAAVKRTEAQAARGFKKTRRDYLFALLSSGDFAAEAIAEERTRQARQQAAQARAAAGDQSRRHAAAAALTDATNAAADRERETAELNAIIEDMDDETITGIVREVIAVDPALKLAARHPQGIRAAIHRPGLRAAFIARARLIASGEPRTIPQEAEA